MEQMMTFHVTDGGETYVFGDWETALEHVRQAFLSDMHPPQDGDEYFIEVKRMSRAEYEAVMEQ